MSWKADVIADKGGQWAGNNLHFARREEAEAYVCDLAFRWTSVTDTRVVESDEPANYFWDGRRAVPIPKFEVKAS